MVRDVKAEEEIWRGFESGAERKVERCEEEISIRRKRGLGVGEGGSCLKPWFFFPRLADSFLEQ